MENINDQNVVHSIIVSKEFWFTLIGAFLALWSNRKLNKSVKYRENLDDMHSVAIDALRILNDLIVIYKTFSLPRKDEIKLWNSKEKFTIESYRTQLLMKYGLNEDEISLIIKDVNNSPFSKKICDLLDNKGIDKDVVKNIFNQSNFINIMNIKFNDLYKLIQGVAVGFSTDIKKLSFITQYNANVLNSVLILNSRLINLNEIIDRLNTSIYEEKSKEFVISMSENFICFLDTTLAFANITSNLLMEYGKTIFKNDFKISSYTSYNVLDLLANYQRVIITYNNNHLNHTC